MGSSSPGGDCLIEASPKLLMSVHATSASPPVETRWRTNERSCAFDRPPLILWFHSSDKRNVPVILHQRSLQSWRLPNLNNV
jgi:hypothetical protein